LFAEHSGRVFGTYASSLGDTGFKSRPEVGSVVAEVSAVFLSVSKKMSGQYLKLCHDCFLSYPLLFIYLSFDESRGSSVSIVSGYGLDDRAIEVRFPAEAKRIFPLASVSGQALGPTQPPVQWVPWVLSPAVKCSRGVTLTEVKNEWELYLLSPLCLHRCVVGRLYLYLFTYHSVISSLRYWQRR
jgi:hypothetical protein